MSVDKLQEKIRKTKNPSVVDLFALPEQIPQQIREVSGDYFSAYEKYCIALMEGLKESVPAVRFSFHSFALMGEQGLALLKKLLLQAKTYDYYVLLDAPEALSATSAAHNAKLLCSGESGLYFDGLILSSYIGSDGLRPYTQYLTDLQKSLFVVVRTANRSAPELQDLLTGSRLVHTANADIVNRLAEGRVGKSGYSQIAAMASASSGESLQTLRSKYKYIFLLLDGYDYPNANAKNCAYAFDRLGHGAAACAGQSIVAAWQEAPDAMDPIACAVEAAQRMKKNITRYITVL